MPDQRPLHILMFDAYGRGGVASATLSLANRLAEHRAVEIISLYRRREKPQFPVDAGVRLTSLRDVRDHDGLLRSALHRRPTRLRPEPSETEMSLLTDRLLRGAVGSLRPGVLLSTRPSLHLAALRFAPEHVRIVGQDHAPYDVRMANPRQVEVLRATLPHLQACTTLTEGDAAAYRAAFPDIADRVRHMPNMLPWPVAHHPAPLVAPVVAAAGRLSKEKGFDRLIRSFASIAGRHPQWRLVIHGEGPARGQLASLVTRLGLTDRVALPGHTREVRSALEQAAVFALPSRHEGFGMALVEAMSLGVPAVSFDCPRGPREIIDDGRNGLLVDDGDLDAFSDALSRMMGDADLRRRLGGQALEDAAAFGPDRVVSRWVELLDEVEATSAAPRS